MFLETTTIEVNGEEIEHSVIKMVESQCMDFEVREIYKDNEIRAEILNFGVDEATNRLLILSGIKNKKKRRDKFIHIYDVH